MGIGQRLFSKQAWNNVKDEFNKKFGTRYDKDQIKNRYNLLRERYNEVKKILSYSGFEWDPVSKNIILGDEGVWKEIVEVI